eukprot:gene525-919_t
MPRVVPELRNGGCLPDTLAAANCPAAAQPAVVLSDEDMDVEGMDVGGGQRSLVQPTASPSPQPPATQEGTTADDIGGTAGTPSQAQLESGWTASGWTAWVLPNAVKCIAGSARAPCEGVTHGSRRVCPGILEPSFYIAVLLGLFWPSWGDLTLVDTVVVVVAGTDTAPAPTSVPVGTEAAAASAATASRKGSVECSAGSRPVCRGGWPYHVRLQLLPYFCGFPVVLGDPMVEAEPSSAAGCEEEERGAGEIGHSREERVGGDKAGLCWRVPRHRQHLVALVADMIGRVRKCPYGRLLQHHCPLPPGLLPPRPAAAPSAGIWSSPAEGADWSSPAEGAAVAAGAHMLEEPLGGSCESPLVAAGVSGSSGSRASMTAAPAPGATAAPGASAHPSMAQVQEVLDGSPQDVMETGDGSGRAGELELHLAESDSGEELVGCPHPQSPLEGLPVRRLSTPAPKEGHSGTER